MNDDKDRMPASPEGRKSKKQPAQGYRGGPFSWLIMGIIILTALLMFQRLGKVDTIEWGDFEQYLKNNQIATVEIGETEITGTFNQAGIAARGEKAPVSFTVDYKADVVGERLTKLLEQSGAKWKFAKPHTWLINLISMLLPVFLIVGFFYFMYARNLRGGVGGTLLSFGRSKHRVQTKDRANVTFKDVAGVDEAKEEVAEIIEFLRNPKKFQRLGGRIPRGVLLVGPPGCGKTLLAKAIAGEANVPFFSISGSDFVEMFVGVGASRVRDLFGQAKANSPCIIFLDEVDAIGRKRGACFCRRRT